MTDGGTENQVHLALAVDGAGWHPAAWREESALPRELTTAHYWTDLAALAEEALADFLSIDDTVASPAAPESTDRVRARLDAELIAARIAPVTRHIGLIPTVTTTHTEPFHVSTAIATLDFTSRGRAGWQPRISPTAAEAGHFGRRSITDPTERDLAAVRSGAAPEAVADLFAEAADAVQVARSLWDSWEDDAEIRDVETRRFIDRDKLHRVDFEGRFFSVRGPSITPRPPQGQPVVAVLAHAPVAYEFAARSADLVFITPTLDTGPAPILADIVDAAHRVDRGGERLRVYADLLVAIDTESATGSARLARLDERAGAPLASDAAVFAGSAAALADLLEQWTAAGVDGIRLRPATLPDDLSAIARQLVPELQRRGVYRRNYPDGPLRGLVGLPTTVPNRYATA